MKKYIALLLCWILLLSLFSCELSENQDDLSSNENTGSSDKKDDSINHDNVTPPSEAEIAMEMYEAAINNEIYVVDEHGREISLNDCRFITNNVTVGECEFINKAILDMDGDGINEYIIQSGDEADHIVLRYYEGKVYSYSFEIIEFRHLNTNGTFYWFSNYWVCGLSRLKFNGSSVSIKEIYAMNMHEDTDPGNDAYYIEGEQVTYEEFIDQFNDYKRDHIARKSFSPLEIACSYPISSARALEIASEYWGVSDWDYDCAAGTTIVGRIVLSSKPSDENGYYRISWKQEYYRHAYPCWEGQTMTHTRVYKEVTVNAYTGKCREYTEPMPDGKG
ncbi:MAG: hypothetical protein IJY08_06875 [Clostridia bacterium]|nr:hypothetical protein [Clostridia bacterium]